MNTLVLNALVTFALILPCAVWAQSTESPQSPPVDGLSLDFLKGERSRDSNSRRFTARWSGSRLDYSGPHPPCVRGRCARSSVTIELTPEQVDTIRTALSVSVLMTAFEEAEATDRSGRYVKGRLTIRRGEQEIRVRVAGMNRYRRGRGGNLSAEARQRLAALERLVSELRSIAAPHLPPEREPSP